MQSAPPCRNVCNDIKVILLAMIIITMLSSHLFEQNWTEARIKIFIDVL